MGFYAPSQIITDAKNHGTRVAPIDVNYSAWDCTIENGSQSNETLRLGMRLIKGFRESQAHHIHAVREQHDAFSSLQDLWNTTHTGNDRLRKQSLFLLAKADAFQSIGLSRREAIWEIRSLPDSPLPT